MALNLLRNSSASRMGSKFCFHNVSRGGKTGKDLIRYTKHNVYLYFFQNLINLQAKTSANYFACSKLEVIIQYEDTPNTVYPGHGSFPHMQH